MRLTALLAASVLAAGAWIACWQQIQLVQLKHQVTAAAGAQSAVRPESIVPPAAPLTQPRSIVSAKPSQQPIDRLQTLLTERKQAIADAEEAATQFGIPSGPEMDQAIAFSVADLDQAIGKLIDPDAVAQLAVVTEPSVPVAPLSPAPVAPAPAPIYVNVTPAPVYVTVAAPAPVVVAAAPAPQPVDDDGTAAIAPTYPSVGGGWGYAYNTNGRNERHQPTQAEKLKSFAASAGIPLAASPLAAVATTSPLLLMRQRMGGR